MVLDKVLNDKSVGFFDLFHTYLLWKYLDLLDCLASLGILSSHPRSPPLTSCL